jgi:hypothetical protein
MDDHFGSWDIPVPPPDVRIEVAPAEERRVPPWTQRVWWRGRCAEAQRTYTRLLVRAMPRHWRRGREAWAFLSTFYRWPHVRERAWDLFANSEADAGSEAPRPWFEEGLLWCNNALLFWLLLPPIVVLWACWLIFTFAVVALLTFGCCCSIGGLGDEVRAELGRFFTAALEFPDDAEVCGSQLG